MSTQPPQSNDDHSNSSMGPPLIAGLILPLVVAPAVEKMACIDLIEANSPPPSNELVNCCRSLSTAFSNIEAVKPGFTYDFVRTLLRNTMEDVTGGSNGPSTPEYAATVLDNELQESVLRLAASVERSPSERIDLSDTDTTAFELEERARELKAVLARIPDQIGDRKTFLETIKEIAGAIKRLLDAVNALAPDHHAGAGALTVESKKREFVRYSKRFSNCLKDYFRHGDAYAVFRSANCLVYQADVIARAAPTSSVKQRSN